MRPPRRSRVRGGFFAIIFHSGPTWKLNVRPLTVVNGFLLGSCFAIAVSLAMVLIVFAVLGGDYPRLQSEFRPLTASLVIFTLMTAISGASFYALIKKHRLRHAAQALLLVGLFATGLYYWP
jgi:uncharacterized membrane protein